MIRAIGQNDVLEAILLMNKSNEQNDYKGGAYEVENEINGEKTRNFQNNLNMQLHQKCWQYKFIINPESFIDFHLTRVNLHFGEFSSLTFQAIS